MTDTCMICEEPAVLTVQAEVTLHGHAAPAGRKSYPPMPLSLCQQHLDEYHGATEVVRS
jgi:hypothetical protein